MDVDQREHRPAGKIEHGGRSAWTEPGREPSLDELLDDPLMALLWRRDRLQPGLARARVMALRAVLADRDREGGIRPAA